MKSNEFQADFALSGQGFSYFRYYHTLRIFLAHKINNLGAVVESGMVDKVERRRKSCSDQGSYAVVPEEFAGKTPVSGDSGL